VDVNASRAQLEVAWANVREEGGRKGWLTAGSAYWVATHPELKKFAGLDPNRLPEVEEIVALAGLVNEANRGVHRLISLNPARGIEYAAQLAWFYDVMGSLYEPFAIALNRVRGEGWLGIEPLIRFLEADPLCFRSGYFKADCIDALTRIELGPEQRARLLAVLLNRLQKPTTAEFRHYVRLARYLDTSELRHVLEATAGSNVQPSNRQARWILDGLVEGRGHRRLLASHRRNRKQRPSD
jgi:hypothetical protein